MTQLRWTFSRITLLSDAIVPAGVDADNTSGLLGYARPPWQQLAGIGISGFSAGAFASLAAGQVQTTVRLRYNAAFAFQGGVRLRATAPGQPPEILETIVRLIPKGESLQTFDLAGTFQTATAVSLERVGFLFFNGTHGAGKLQILGKLL